MNLLPSIELQMQAVDDFFVRQAAENDYLKYDHEEALAA
jgi:tRNA-dihydrouridine synthase B